MYDVRCTYILAFLLKRLVGRLIMQPNMYFQRTCTCKLSLVYVRAVAVQLPSACEFTYSVKAYTSTNRFARKLEPQQVPACKSNL